MKKIMFMGTPDFSVEILKKLIEVNYTIVAVVTQPDRLVGRKKVLTPPPVKVLAEQYDLPVYQPEKLVGSKELEQLLQLDVDLIVTAAYGQFLPTRLLNYPKYDAINVHASLLPRYRGGAPIHYAIMNGDRQTGVTIMKMSAKMDAGAMYAQAALPITAQDDVGTMFQKLSVLGAELLCETLPKLFDETIEAIEQDEKLVTYAPTIRQVDEQIDWQKSAQDLDCFVRGLRPWPVAFTLLNGKRYKIWRVTPLENTVTDRAIGTLYTDDLKRILVACGDQTVLEINEIQPAGKAKMDAIAFYNGFKELLNSEQTFEAKKATSE